MKKALMVTSVASMISFFNLPNIKTLQKLGYEVTVITNFNSPGGMPTEDAKKLRQDLKELNVSTLNIEFSRSPFSIKNFHSYQDLFKHLNEEKYDLIHCQSPVGGAITRIATRKKTKIKARILYTAHGFHFFKGAPWVNWVVYYPIEKFLSYFTDVLITINQEDYKRAEKMKMKKARYIPGVGVDLESFRYTTLKSNIRRELNISETDFVMLSVGELNDNKNHSTILKAMKLTNKPNIHYLICGEGVKKKELNELSKQYELEKQVHLLGFRTDIAELCKESNIFVFPSKREGLGLAAIEAMAAGLPILTSNVHGINDYSIHGKTGFKYAPENIRGFREGIEKFYNMPKEHLLKIGTNNSILVEKFSSKNVSRIMEEIYELEV